jgi:hypothetical protein
MSVEANPAAPHHLPMFISEPGQPDVLFNVMLGFLIFAVLLVIVFYFKLHSLPERLAHKGQKIQLELVAVLGLISLFTHNHLFWIAGLLLAFIPIPDFSTPLERMADALGRMAGWRRPPPGADEVLPVQESSPAPAPAHAIGDGANDLRPAAVATSDAAAALGLADRGSARPATDDPARRLRSHSKESA